MSNSRKFIIGLIVVVLVALAGGAAYWFRGKPEFTSPVTSGGKEEDPKLTLIEDEWGLKLAYPATLQAKAATGTGELTRYTLTDPVKQGHLSVYSKETSAKTVDEWMLDEGDADTSSGALDTEVGGVPAKKMRFSDPLMTQIVAVDAGQVFIFESHPIEGEEKYWEDALAHVVEQFKFLPFEGEEEIAVEEAPAAPADDSGGDVIVEEEVVE